MAVDDLARADPVPRLIAWLNNDADVTAALGGTGRVSAYNEPPYPHLRVVETPAGIDGDLRWLIGPEVQIEAYGDLDGTPGKAALRRILYMALGSLVTVPDAVAPPEGPIITAVMSTRGGGWVPEPSGQPRYVATVRVWSHAAP